MYPTRASTSLRCFKGLFVTSKHAYATTRHSTPEPHRSKIINADVILARTYCSDLLRKFDGPSYTLQTFIPSSIRDAYLSIRALNIELARIPDLVSNPTVGTLRMQFWRDNIIRTLAGTPPKEPLAILLHHAISTLQQRHPSLSTDVLKAWFMKVINTREKYMNNQPYPTLEALESYAENTYSTLLYLTLAALPLHSLCVDHLASHIGKAAGIVAVLRGLPLIAFPPPPNHHSNNGSFGGAFGGAGSSRQGAVLLPLDVMAQNGVIEEVVLRQGAHAPGLKDAIFAVASRANNHLVTAREMLENVQQGKAAGHNFEHEGETGHHYVELTVKENTQKEELEKGFGVLMSSVATKLWLEELEKADFDVFRPELRTRGWKLPWRAYWAYNRRQI